MKFYSTQNKNTLISIQEAIVQTIASNGGVYMPEQIPALPTGFLTQERSFNEIAFEIAKLFLGDQLNKTELQSIIQKAFNFEVQLIRFNERLHALELFNGPTGSDKDIAARFMAQLISAFVDLKQQEHLLLVPTTGDTGAAIANSFLKMPGVKVVILYPSGKISQLQEKQLTTLQNNVTALEIQGSYDDCKQLVQQATQSQTLTKKLKLIAATPTNFALLLAQTFYHAYAAAQFANDAKPLTISVPSGDLSSLTAGLMAKQMGANIHQLVAATNANDAAAYYLKTGFFKPSIAKQTLASSIDTGNPANFEQMQELYNKDVQKLKNNVYGVAFSDADIKQGIKELKESYNYIADPQTAISYLGLFQFMQKHMLDCRELFLATTHPAKFAPTIAEILQTTIETPKAMQACLKLPKEAVLMNNNFDTFKEFLLTGV